MDSRKCERESGYANAITSLPEAELPFEKAKGWVLQGEASQLVFWEFEPEAKVPEHCHPYLQWGFVIEGKMEFIVNGAACIYEKGDEYIVPAEAKHCARFLAATRVVDLFSEKSRYKVKSVKKYP